MEIPSGKKEVRIDTKDQDYVVVAVLEDHEQADDYRRTLEANDIPARVEEQAEVDESLSYRVMVPDEYLDEAHVVIESQDAYDDFYDMAMDDESDDFDDDDEMIDDDY